MPNHVGPLPVEHPLVVGQPVHLRVTPDGSGTAT
jgi:hypothetical protein